MGSIQPNGALFLYGWNNSFCACRNFKKALPFPILSDGFSIGQFHPLLKFRLTFAKIYLTDQYGVEKNKMDNMQTGKLIAELRKKHGLTQQQLADKLNLSNKTISKWESGSGSPDISNLPVLAEAFGISVDELLKGELNKQESDTNLDVPKDCSPRKELTPKQKKEWAVIALAASIGAILGILAYNFGWLG